MMRDIRLMQATFTPSLNFPAPLDMDKDKFDNMVYELCDYFNRKDITVEQAQCILNCCLEMVLKSVVNI